nr:mitochondrial import inner membrane translocase subunit Tim10-like [Saimiri boliviensis boliviensis]
MGPLRAQQLSAELEVEMMADMYDRMTSAYHRRCVPPHYKEAELSKGKSVCLDRCVSKYLGIHERMGKKLTELSMQAEELIKRVQQSSGPEGGPSQYTPWATPHPSPHE